MTSCCHCGRVLTNDASKSRGCGSYCLENKGHCMLNSNFKGNGSVDKLEGREELKGKLIKGIAKGAIIGAAVGVTCVLAHVACIITAFIHNHSYLKSASLSVYSVLKNKSEHDKHPVKEAAMSGTTETLNTISIDALSSRMGDKFAEAAHETSKTTSLSWAIEIGKETGRGILEQVSIAVFDWGSKVVV